MILEYKFVYQSNNNYFVEYIDNILKQKETKYYINRENENIFLYVEDEEERLLKISDELSNELPISIFLKDFALEVVSQIPLINYQYTLDSCQKSYCSNCLAEIENKEMTNYYNPFINCQLCGTTSNVKSLDIFENKEKIEFDSFKNSFEFLASKIAQGKTLEIKNTNKKIYLKKLEKVEYENQTVLCTDINNLSKIAVGSKQKNILLLSLEKPIIEFNLNAIYKKSMEIEFDKINVIASWDLVIYLLSKELQKLNIDFLSIEQDNQESSVTVEYERELNFPKISVTENNIYILENNCYDKRLNKVYNSFDEKSKSQFMVLLDENKLYEKTVLNFFISSKYDDGINLYSSKIDGLVDIVKYNIPNSISELIENIEKTENGDKLINSYKEKFPDIYKKAIESNIDNNLNSITNLWKIASTILDLDDIYKTAKSCLLQKGPRIDYKLKKSDKLFNKEFDIVSFIKSGISFKLAGVEEKTLSLGYVESFIYFISDLYDEVNEQFEVDGVSFCGDYIGEEIINKLIAKAFNKTSKLYYNKDFPIQL
ncbi:hypothetical protein [Halarcobacter sp.]|uniref:hypothetical protein n=1 Tax=Halarcobacter sp. TaxID=2321133 RepID=UPI002AAB4272|nr:hypothetical protein [Halarcobacter sp.]